MHALNAIEMITEGHPLARGIAVDGSVVYFSTFGAPAIEGGLSFGTVMQVANMPGSTAVTPAL
jgi:hypothetical protein